MHTFIVRNLSILLVSVVVLAAAQPKRVCYYNTWAMTRDRKEALYPEHIDPFLCTHVVMAFAQLDITGTKIVSSKEDESLNIYRRAIHMLRKENANVHVLLSVGGWAHSGDSWHRLMSSTKNMQTFATNCIKTLRRHDFDGIEIDFQYPGHRASGKTGTDKTQFYYFLRLLKWELDHEEHPDLKWTMALVISINPNIDEAKKYYWDIVKYSRHVNWINMRMFDLHGVWDDTGEARHHSALTGKGDRNNVNNLAQYWTEKGVPREKMVIGIAALGKSYKLAYPGDRSKHPRIIGMGKDGGTGIPYNKVCKLLEEEHKHGNHEVIENGVPHIVVGDQWIGYDNEESVKKKARLVLNNQLAGVSLFAMDNDDYNGNCGKKYPLLNAMLDGLQARHDYNNNKQGSGQDKFQKERAIKAIYSQRATIWKNQDRAEASYQHAQVENGRRFW